MDPHTKRRKRTHLPPAIVVKIIPLDDLYALTCTKGDFVFVFWDEVVASIDVFYHGNCSVLYDM